MLHRAAQSFLALPFTVRGVSVSLFALAASQIMTAIVDVAIARHLGASALGVFAVAVSIANVSGAAVTASFGSAATRAIAQADERAQGGAARAALLGALVGASLTSLVAAVAWFVAAPQLSLLLFESAVGERVFQVFALGLPLNAAAAVALAAARALNAVRTELLYRVADVFLRLFAVLAMYLLGIGLDGIATLYLIASAVTLVIPTAALLGASGLRGAGPDIGMSLRTPVSALGHSAATAVWLLARRTDLLVLSAVFGPSAAGYYRLATILPAFAGLVLAALPPFFAVRVARHLVQGAATANEYFLSVVRLALPPATILLMAALTFSDVMVSLLAPGVSIAPIVPFLVMAQFVDVAAGPCLTYLLMTGRARLVVTNLVSASATHLTLLLILVQPLGLVGAAVSTLVSVAVLNGLQLRRLRDVVGLSLDNSWSTPVILSVVALGVTWTFSGLGLLPRSLLLALTVVTYSWAYWSRVLPDERELLRTIRVRI